MIGYGHPTDTRDSAYWSTVPLVVPFCAHRMYEAKYSEGLKRLYAAEDAEGP